MKVAIPWTGDAMTYVLEHVQRGVIRVDPDGSIWRCAIRRGNRWKSIEPRRVENLSGKGYLRVSLQKPDGGLAIVMAHRLVHEVFIGPVPLGLQINHKDLNKTNNTPSNLEVVTGARNIQHSYENGRTRPWSQVKQKGGTWRGKPILTEQQKQTARDLRASGVKLKRIASELGISITHAHRITEVK